MVNRSGWSRFALRALTTGALYLAAGCHYVQRNAFNAEVAQLRQDMASGDREVLAQATNQTNALAAKTDERMATLEQVLATGLSEIDAKFGARVQRIEGALQVQASVYFGLNRAVLDSGELPVLDRLASVIQEYYPDALLTVEGFTDAAGSRGYNMRLGQRRADEVRQYLVTKGRFAPDQVRSVSYGEESARLVSPGFGGPGDRGRENRRVVIVIDDPRAGAARRSTTQ